MHNLTFLYDWSSSAFRSARLTSKTRPFSSSVAILVPVVLVTSVFPQFVRLMPGLSEPPPDLKMLDALMSYHSFFKNGSPTFFLPPFFPPFVRRLFLPTAIALRCAKTPGLE